MSNDYAREPVPAEAAVRSAKSISIMVSSAAMGVPVMILGCSIGIDYGASKGFLVIVLGCAVTALLASLLAHAGVRSRRSTALLAAEAFGTTGAHLLNLVIAVALLGWFSVEMGFVGSMMSAGMRDVFGAAIGPGPGILIASVVICAVCLFGIGLVLRAPLLFLPLLGALLFVVFFLTVRHLPNVSMVPLDPKPIGTGVSSIVGAYIVGCLIMPDYSRFVRSSQAAAGAVTVALGPVYGLVLATYSLAGLITHASEPNAILIGLGIPALVGLLLPIGLMQNGIMCLYSAALATTTLLHKISIKAILVALTVIGLGMALAGISGLFVRFLVILGIVFPPAVALLIYAGITIRKATSLETVRVKWAELLVWAIGIACGACSEMLRLGLTGFSAFDGFLAAAFGVAVLHIAKSRLNRLATR